MDKTTPRHKKQSNCSKPAIKRKILKQPEEKTIHYIQRNKDNNDGRILVGNNVNENSVE